MKRRILSLALTLCMILTLTPVAAFADEGDVTETPPSTTEEENTDQTPEAQAENGLPGVENGVITLTTGNYTLLDNITSSIVVPKNATVTLNLNDHTVTNTASKDTIYVELGGSLTIAGNGTVDNTSHQRAAVFNNGTAVLTGGNYTRSQENSKNNTYYNIVNHGNMTINNGTSVTQNGNFSSLVENGYYSYNYVTNKYTTERHIYIEDTNQANPKMTIDGGTFSGGINTIKNDDGATLVINDGTFSNVTQAAFLNWNVAEVNGGTFTVESGATAVILNGGGDNTINKGELTITGGTFGTGNTTAIAAMNDNETYLKKENVQITGGTFSSDVKEFAPDGYTSTDNNGNYTIGKKTAPDDNDVAKINDQYFTTLQGAIAAAENGDTVELLKDTEITHTTISKGIILDLKQNTLSLAEDGNYRATCLLFTSGTSEIKNGTIVDNRVTGTLAGYQMIAVTGSSTSLTTSNVTLKTYRPNSIKAYTYIVSVQGGAKLTLNSGTQVIDEKLPNVENEEHAKTTYGAIGVTVYGEGTHLTVNEGTTISTMGFAISGNGSNNSASWKPEITINGGSITSSHSQAIYHPQIGGKITVNDGTITGATGIEMRAGDLIINGGTITATADEFSCAANGNGSTTTGAAIAIAQHTTKQDISVSINDGTFNGIKALNESNPQSNDPAPKVNMSITDGKFIGEITVSDVPADGFISGGTYSQDVNDDYIVPGAVDAQKGSDGTWIIVPKSDSVVAIGNVGYDNLDTALAAAQYGDTITLLDDIIYSGKIILPAGITLNGNDKNLTAAATVTDGCICGKF